jgi:hypothetical protein
MVRIRAHVNAPAPEPHTQKREHMEPSPGISILNLRQETGLPGRNKATSVHPPWPRSGCCLRHQPWKCQPLAAWSIDHPARGKMHLGTMQQLIKIPCFTHGNQGQLSCQVPLPCKKERNMRHPQRKVKTLMMSVASKQLCFHITVELQLLRSRLPMHTASLAAGQPLEMCRAVRTQTKGRA